MQKAVNQRVETIFIDLNDLEDFCKQEIMEPDDAIASATSIPKIQLQQSIENWIKDIEKNALRFTKYFYEACAVRPQGAAPQGACRKGRPSMGAGLDRSRCQHCRSSEVCVCVCVLGPSLMFSRMTPPRSGLGGQHLGPCSGRDLRTQSSHLVVSREFLCGFA